jgi:hypothetical protein
MTYGLLALTSVSSKQPVAYQHRYRSTGAECADFFAGRFGSESVVSL